MQQTLTDPFRFRKNPYMRSFRLFAISFFLFSGLATAQALTPYERILFPTFSQTLARNDGLTPAEFYPIPPQPPGECQHPFGCSAPPVTFPAKSTFTIGSYARPSAMFYLKRENISQVHLAGYREWAPGLDVTAGTEIPVVRERDFHSTTLHLIEVMVHQDYETVLRIYDTGPATLPERTVRIRIHTLQFGTNALLKELVVALPRPALPAGSDPSYPMIPGHAAVDLTHELGSVTRPIRKRAVRPPTITPSAIATDFLRIEVEPVSTELTFWAFATVTNKQSRLVNIVTPH